MGQVREEGGRDRKGGDRAVLAKSRWKERSRKYDQKTPNSPSCQEVEAWALQTRPACVPWGGSTKIRWKVQGERIRKSRSNKGREKGWDALRWGSTSKWLVLNKGGTHVEGSKCLTPTVPSFARSPHRYWSPQCVVFTAQVTDFGCACRWSCRSPDGGSNDLLPGGSS